MIKKSNPPPMDIQQIERLVDQLPQRDKLHLFRKLGKETAVQRMKEIFKEIDERRKTFPISNKEIQEEIEGMRRKIYGSRRR